MTGVVYEGNLIGRGRAVVSARDNATRYPLRGTRLSRGFITNLRYSGSGALS